MKIEQYRIKIRDIREGYETNDETNEVFTNVKATKENKLKKVARLNIRPAYQRNFVYSPDKRDEVIRTILKGFPLNVMYWVKNDDGTFEILDGQQRTISVLDYVRRDGVSFSLDEKYFHSLSEEVRNQILDYELMVYICEGSYEEKLAWFKVINIAGVKLTEQELRNAMFTGPWLYDAKRYFSRRECAAQRYGKGYVAKEPTQQELLELALDWIVCSSTKCSSIENYMSLHQNDKNAAALWSYYQEVIDWVKRTFIKYRNEMKGLPWGRFYQLYKSNSYNPQELEKTIERLYKDDDVSSKKGIYEYVLSGNERTLNIRAFSDTQKAQGYETCCGICAKCGERFEIEEMEADHVIPWSKGGKTDIANLQMLCLSCNRRKSDK